MLVEVDLSSILASMSDGGEAGVVDHHDENGNIVASFHHEDHYDLVRTPYGLLSCFPVEVFWCVCFECL